MNISYDELCKRINKDYSLMQEPTRDDLLKLSIKYKVDISIVRECVGLKDYYEFVIDED